MSDTATQQTGRVEPSAASEDYLAQIDIPQAQMDEAINWALSEIEKAKAERGELESRLAEWERLYEARPKVKIKTFPWYDCSNLVVPVIATAVDAVLARLMNAIFGAKELWVGTPRSPNWVALIEPVQTWLNWAGDEVMDMYRVCQKWFLGMLKFGTGVLKLPWETRKRNVIYKDAGGNLVSELITVHQGPAPTVIPLADFFHSSDALISGDVQNCEWVAHRTSKTWKKIKELETSKIYFDVDRIKENKRTQATDVEQEIMENVGYEIMEHKDYEIWEMWASYDVNKDGIPEELVLTIQPDARVALRAVYNFYRHQERPLHLIRFMPRDNSLLGIGLCQMLQDIQEEITAIHNQRIDNATLSNTATFLKRKNAIITSNGVYPGGFIEVDDIEGDIKALDYGRIHHTLLPEELHSNSIGEKRTGVSDYTVGRESAAIGSRATATSTLALIREGNKRFAMTIRDIREGLGDIAHQVIMLYQQFAPNSEVMYEIFSDKEKQVMQMFMQLPPDYTRSGILIDTPALSEYDNKELTRQGLMTIMGILQGFYGGLFQAMGVALSPQAPEPLKQLAVQGAKAGSMIWQRLLETFDFRDAEQFAPDIEEILSMGATLEGAFGLGGGNGQGTVGETPGGQAASLGGQAGPAMAATPGGAGAPAGLGAQQSPYVAVG
jgi:hypothetical protein